jgi:hypothetical protein
MITVFRIRLFKKLLFHHYYPTFNVQSKLLISAHYDTLFNKSLSKKSDENHLVYFEIERQISSGRVKRLHYPCTIRNWIFQDDIFPTCSGTTNVNGVHMWIISGSATYIHSNPKSAAQSKTNFCRFGLKTKPSIEVSIAPMVRDRCAGAIRIVTPPIIRFRHEVPLIVVRVSKITVIVTVGR